MQEMLLFMTALRRPIVESAEERDDLDTGEAALQRQLFIDLL